ncbi:MAG: recombinase family protein [Acidocella sp.]|uniref:recombinase family protein n=1 Tax=Acidocella sp. TaxID=50710 RepID=UPI003FC88280
MSKQNILRKAYSYLRFSTPEQARGDSFRRQTDLALDYANRHDLELDEVLSFHDLGVSAYRGSNAETGQLGALLEAVRVGLIAPGSVVLVESLDRISRQAARKALRVIESIVETGVSVVTLSDGREYTATSLDNDPLSLMMALLTFVRANEESATKGRRVAAAWAAKRACANQQPLTSRCPGWIQLDLESRTFVLIPDRAAIVRRMYDEALSGRGTAAIARRLNVEGVPVFGDGSRKGAMWHDSYIVTDARTPTVCDVDLR